VFYTDGIVDASIGGQDYGIGRLRGLVDTHAVLPATGLGDRILHDLDTFSQGSDHADDVTVVVVKIL
jgi:serine phosphatase RsbU (regulator of sigma subunit)